MRTIARLLAARFAAFTAAVLIAAAPAAEAQAPARGAYAFTNVAVIPMDNERVLEDRTVVVEDGRITALGPAESTPVPEGATRIDGRGKFLLPGLAEMHAHIPTTREEAEDFSFLYLAGGATTIRGMLGHPSQLELRQRVRAGEIVGPRMRLAAPALRGQNVPDTATAERLVRAAAADGYDLLKIQEGLSAEVYAAIAETAGEVGIPFAGHVPADVGVHGALEAGQATIDHFDDYLDALQPEDSPALQASGAERQRLLPLHADETRIPELVRATREAGVAVVPTQMLWETLRGARDPAELAARPENRYVPASMRASWLESATAMHERASRASAEREAELRQRLLKAMNDGGVRVLLGTDAPQVFSVPGFSLHRELPLMVESGMTPYEVLRTGTVNVAEHLGLEAQSGTVAVGRNADLLLLEANPLEDIRAVERNAGVMVDGRWLGLELIEARLQALAEKYSD